MTDLSTNVQNLAIRVGTEFKTAYAAIDATRVLISGNATGDLTSLVTGTRTNLVAALNETYQYIVDVQALITDLQNNEFSLADIPNASAEVVGLVQLATAEQAIDGTSSVLAVTPEGVKAAIAQVVGGAPETLDTLEEIAAALGADPNLATTILDAVANRVRFDAPQGLAENQQQQALSNIGAVSYTEFTETIGDVVNTNFVAVFEGALA